jgi:hypothetical protein
MSGKTLFPVSVDPVTAFVNDVDTANADDVNNLSAAVNIIQQVLGQGADINALTLGKGSVKAALSFLESQVGLRLVSEVLPISSPPNPTVDLTTTYTPLNFPEFTLSSKALAIDALLYTASFAGNGAICLDPSDGSLYLTDHPGRIRKVTSDGAIHTIAGNGTIGHGGDGGPAVLAQIGAVSGLQIVGTTLYFCETPENYQGIPSYAFIRKIELTTGIVTTLCGDGLSNTPPTSGQPALGNTMGYCHALAVDPATRDIYFSDGEGHAVYKISASSGILTNFAGIYGDQNHTGDGGPAVSAEIAGPYSLAVANGGLYIGESSGCTVRFVDFGTGNISTPIFTFAGLYAGTYSGDGGPAANAGSGTVTALAKDTAGNIYIGVATNPNGSRVRKANLGTGGDGTVNTLFGAGANPANSYEAIPDGSPWSGGFGSTTDALAIDAQGNIFFIPEWNGPASVYEAVLSSQQVFRVAGAYNNTGQSMGWNGDDRIDFKPTMTALGDTGKTQQTSYLINYFNNSLFANLPGAGVAQVSAKTFRFDVSNTGRQASGFDEVLAVYLTTDPA